LPAFTIVEMVVVLAILTILVALVTSVSGYIMRHAREQETANTQAIVLEAIQAYRDNHPSQTYPPDSDLGGGTSGNVLLRHLTGSLPTPGPGVSVPYGAVRAARDVLLKLPADAWDTASQEVRDGWGRAMQYHDDGALGGGPWLISAGADRDFGTDADNIRSDEAR
jgi:type II secretory pathway pseudopilin PulG